MCFSPASRSSFFMPSFNVSTCKTVIRGHFGLARSRTTGWCGGIPSAPRHKDVLQDPSSSCHASSEEE